MRPGEMGHDMNTVRIALVGYGNVGRAAAEASKCMVVGSSEALMATISRSCSVARWNTSCFGTTASCSYLPQTRSSLPDRAFASAAIQSVSSFHSGASTAGRSSWSPGNLLLSMPYALP